MATCYKAFHRRVVPSLDLQSRGLRHRRRDHGEGRARGLPRLRGPGLLLRPLARGGQEDPPEGRLLRARRAGPALASARARSVEPRRGARLAAASAVLAAGAALRARARPHAGATRCRPTSRSTSSPATSRSSARHGHRQHRASAADEGARGPRPRGPAAAAAARERSRWATSSSTFGHAFLFENRVVARRDRRRGAGARFSLVLAALLLLVFFAARARYGTVPALFAAALLAFDPNLRRARRASSTRTSARRSRSWRPCSRGTRAVRGGPSAGRARSLAAAVPGPRARRRSSPAVYLAPDPRSCQALLAARRRGAQPGRGAGRAGSARLLAASARSRSSSCSRSTPSSPRGWTAPTSSQIIRGDGRRCGGAPALAARHRGVRRRLAAARRTTSAGSPPSRGRTPIGGGINVPVRPASRPRAFPRYFFVAFAAKIDARLPRRDGARSSRGAVVRPAGAASRRSGASSCFPSLVLFLASIGTTLQHRHPPPAAGVPVPGALRRRRSSRACVDARRDLGRARRPPAAAGCALPLVSAVELARIHPHELSYFNPFAGGPGEARRDPHGLERRLGPRSRGAWPTSSARRGVRGSRRSPTSAATTSCYRLGRPRLLRRPVVRGRLVADLGLPAGRRARVITRTMAPRRSAEALARPARDDRARGQARRAASAIRSTFRAAEERLREAVAS